MVSPTRVVACHSIQLMYKGINGPAAIVGIYIKYLVFLVFLLVGSVKVINTESGNGSLFCTVS